MDLTLIGLILVLILLIIGLLFHWIIQERTYKTIASLSEIQVHKRKLSEDMLIHQGSNFNAMMMSAWILFFIAIAYLYFLTPTVFSRYNYFQYSDLASSPFGFFILGLFSLPFSIIFSISFVKLYRFYEITKENKTVLIGAIPLLYLSLILSAYAGIIYPEIIPIIEFASFLLILVSELILLSPIIIAGGEIII